MATNRKQANHQKSIPTLVKNSALVEEKRARIVEAAVGLIVRKGFHQTTTREIAREAGFSIGSLYEYVASKEDVLYLVCDSIHREMEAQLRDAIDDGKPPREALEEAIRSYIRVCDRMQDTILLIYRETASLNSDARPFVLENEQRIAELFENILHTGAKQGVFDLDGVPACQLMAQNIVVLGHMWAFRRWYLRDRFSLDQYIDHQTALILGELTGQRTPRRIETNEETS